MDKAKSLCGLYKNGTTLLTIKKAFEAININSTGIKISFGDFIKTFSIPCIIYWNKSHFVVVWHVSDTHVIVGDPAIGNMTYSINEFNINTYRFTKEFQIFLFC